MTDRYAKLADHAARFLSQHAAPHRLTIDIEGCVIRIAATSEPLAAALRHYYRAHVVRDRPAAEFELVSIEAEEQKIDVDLEVYPPAPGKTRIKDEYIDYPDGRLLRKRATGMVFLFGPEHNVAIGPCLANLNQVVNFINNRFIDRQIRRGYLLCHAAGVARGDRGIAVAGVAGRGKSTLALHLIGGGFHFVSNDRLLIHRRHDVISMVGLPKHPRVNPGTLLNNEKLLDILSPEQQRTFAALPRDELWDLEYKFDVDVERVFGTGRSRLSTTMIGAVILNWERGGGPTRADVIDLRTRPDLLAALTKSPGVHYRRRQGAPELAGSDADYLAVLEQRPILEISGDIDFAHAANVCRELLDHDRLPGGTPIAQKGRIR
jgi:HprK-related kinase B